MKREQPNVGHTTTTNVAPTSSSSYSNRDGMNPNHHHHTYNQSSSTITSSTTTTATTLPRSVVTPRDYPPASASMPSYGYHSTPSSSTTTTTTSPMISIPSHHPMTIMNRNHPSSSSTSYVLGPTAHYYDYMGQPGMTILVASNLTEDDARRSMQSSTSSQTGYMYPSSSSSFMSSTSPSSTTTNDPSWGEPHMMYGSSEPNPGRMYAMHSIYGVPPPGSTYAIMTSPQQQQGHHPSFQSSMRMTMMPHSSSSMQDAPTTMHAPPHHQQGGTHSSIHQPTTPSKKLKSTKKPTKGSLPTATSSSSAAAPSALIAENLRKFIAEAEAERAVNPPPPFPASSSLVQPFSRARHSMNENGIVKGPWLPHEDALLIRLVESCGPKRKWSHIAQQVPGRLGKQCRERWLNHLDQNVKKSPWTSQEDDLLLRAQKKMGNRWCEIAKLLPGRPENAVKNRFNSIRYRQLHAYTQTTMTENGSHQVKRLKRLNPDDEEEEEEEGEEEETNE